MRTVDTETAMWRLALALEVMFKVISLPDLLVNICATFDLANPQSRVFRGLVTTASGFVQSTLLASHVPNRDSVGAPSGMSAGHQPSQKPALIYRGGNFVIADVQKFAILELLDRLEPPCLPEGYSLRLAISCLLQFVWSLQHVIQRVKSSDKPQTEHKMLKLSWTGLLPALSLLLEACADEKLTDSFLLAESVMVVLSSLCGLGDSREAFVASICKSALPSLSVLSERLSPKHRQPPQVCDEATDRSPVVIVVNANHGPGNLSLEVSSSSSSGGSSVDVPPGTNGSQAPSSLFITAKHIQISKSLLELAKTNGSLLESSWFPVLTTMQQLVWMLGLRAAPSATGSSMSNAQNAPTPMSLDTSFFENASAPNIATQGGGVVSKVISELPTLSQTLSFVFEQSKNFDEIALGYLIRALCSVASETLEISTTNR
uniref:Mon2_C domain-containing protein n=1 Tax=Mesocestoides corti TaxID=53468 RepID=A0A5K3FRM2_MESCO